jgi:diketogulonate reductase-like aldo/keto reductase
MIPKKRLRCGFELPILGLGTWLMGGDMARATSPQDQLDIRAIQTAIDMGYTHIDTAEIYGDGHAEELVRTAIGPYDRQQLFLASKVRQGRHDKAQLAAALDGSLKRLGTDYLDLYSLHRPTLETPFEETAAALNSAYKAGKIRAIGVCNFLPQTLDALQSFLDVPIRTNQVHYNLAFREPEACGLLQHAEEKDYFLVAWRPLRLTKRGEAAPKIAANIWDKGAFPLLDQVAEKYHATNSQIALAWTVAPKNLCALLKSSNPIHLQEGIDGIHISINNSDYRILSDNFNPIYQASDTVPLT